MSTLILMYPDDNDTDNQIFNNDCNDKNQQRKQQIIIIIIAINYDYCYK